MKPDKIRGMLSLSAKAGSVVSGEYAVCNAVKTGKAKLVLIASDLSERSAKSYADLCDYYRVPLFVYATKDTFGAMIGKEFRAACAVCNDKLADRLIALLSQQTSGE